MKSEEIFIDVKKNEDGKYGYINAQGKVIIPFEYDEMYMQLFRVDLKEGIEYLKFFISLKDDKWGILSYNGKIWIPFEYSAIEVLENTRGQLLKVNDNFQWGIVDFIDRKTILPCYFEEIEVYVFGDSAFFIVEEEAFDGNKKGIYDFRGEILPSEYDEIFIHDEKDKIFFTVQKNNKWGAFDHNGKLLLPIKYDDLIPAETEEKIYLEALIDDKQELLELYI